MQRQPWLAACRGWERGVPCCGGHPQSPFPPATLRGTRDRKVLGAYSGFSLEEGSLLENTWNLLGLEYGVKVLPPAGSSSINSGKGFVLTTLNCAGFVP